MLRILYVAGLSEVLGCADEALDVPEEVRDVAGLLQCLRRRGGRWQEWMQENAVQVTVNRRFATARTPVRDGDEIAFVNARP